MTDYSSCQAKNDLVVVFETLLKENRQKLKKQRVFFQRIDVREHVSTVKFIKWRYFNSKEEQTSWFSYLKLHDLQSFIRQNSQTTIF